MTNVISDAVVDFVGALYGSEYSLNAELHLHVDEEGKFVCESRAEKVTLVEPMSFEYDVEVLDNEYHVFDTLTEAVRWMSRNLTVDGNA